MPTLERKIHTFNLGTQNYYVIVPDVYAGNGSNIAGAVGMTALGDNASVPADSKRLSVSEGLMDGKFIRYRLTHQTATGKSKSSRIICPVDKATTAVGDLLGKNYRGNKITGVGVPRRRRLG